MGDRRDEFDTLILSDEAIRRVISLQDTITLVEAAFAADATGGAFALPVVVERINAFAAQFGVKSGYINSSQWSRSGSRLLKYLAENVGDVLGLKAGGYWLRNPEVGLPGHRAVMILFDPVKGSVIAILAANAITRLRTAAGGAVSAKYLAREHCEVACVVGAGEQAQSQLEALQLVRPFRRMHLWTRRRAAAEALASHYRSNDMEVHVFDDIRAASKDADIIITATNSTEALIHSDFVRSGTHIIAVGSDAKGKQELDVELLRRATIVVDKVSQSIAIGELQHAITKGWDARGMIHAELGEICAGIKTSRQSEDEITIFDSSGVSFQDLVVAGYLVHKSQTQHIGNYVRL